MSNIWSTSGRCSEPDDKNAFNQRQIAVVGILLSLSLWIAGLVWKLSSEPFATQDDMGQHIVWFRRFLPSHSIDSSAIGDFFLASNGILYRMLYENIAVAGIDPIAAAWVIGMGATVVAAIAAGSFVRAIGIDSIIAALVPAALILFLSFRDDMVTGSARSIGWPIFMIALCSIAQRRLLSLIIILSIGALIYPPVVALALFIGGVDRLLIFWKDKDWQSFAVWGTGFAVPAGITLATLLPPDPWGPTVTLMEALHLPDFQRGGRTHFFDGNWWVYWLIGTRSGLIPSNIYHAWPMIVAALYALFFLPWNRALMRWICIIALSGIILWMAAHLTLFTLYLPSRFPSYAIGMCIVLLTARLAGHLYAEKRRWLLMLSIVAPLAFYGGKGSWPYAGIRGLDSPELTTALREQSETGIVAGFSPDLDRLPIAAWRTVYWSWEVALPYKSRYRVMMRDRLGATADALLAFEPGPVLDWAATNDISFFLLPKDIFASIHSQRWMTMVDVRRRTLLTDPTLPERSWLWHQRSGFCAKEGKADWLISITCLREHYGRT